jgi:hypothetical protein
LLAGLRTNLCDSCATETTVSPHASAIALPVLPRQAYGNLEKLRSDYPGIYKRDGGFYDAVNPRTGSIGHRRLVLDQSMIMAAIDDALNEPRIRETRPAGFEPATFRSGGERSIP